MSRRIVTISFTELNAGGGVPAFNRALRAAFPDRVVRHYCAADFPTPSAFGFLPEWEQAKSLNRYLIQTRQVTHDDIIIADGFWAAGLESFPFAVSVAHGIWSHLTREDVDAGKQPDMPLHHAAQVAFRGRWSSLKKSHVAVSEFIRNQMWLQWGFESHVINNGHPSQKILSDERRKSLRELIELPVESTWLWGHGVNDSTNLNKGMDHIEAVYAMMDSIGKSQNFSLDQLRKIKKLEKELEPGQFLQLCDFAVVPSGYEGNSYFTGELLSSGVPIVAYDVGLLYQARKEGWSTKLGELIDRRERDTSRTAAGARDLCQRLDKGELLDTREFIRNFSPERFEREWQCYIHDIESKA